MSDRLLIIDGHNYLYRAYYGVPETATLSDGTKVNAVFGFLAFLRKALNLLKPEKMIVVFDSETGTSDKRNLRPEYKANRNYLDTGMFSQLTIIKKILNLAKVKFIENPEQEADDIIGSLSNYFSNLDDNVFISSNDYDFVQLIKHNISLIREIKGKLYLFNKLEVEKKFGISPEQYLDYLALQGDKSDNIQGVKGIGNKTSRKLILQYKTLENIIENSIFMNNKILHSIQEYKFDLLSNKSILKINTYLEINKILLDSNCTYDYELLTEKAKILLNKINCNYDSI